MCATARQLGRRLSRLALLGPAVALLSVTLLLAVGCTAASDSGTTGGSTSSGGSRQTPPRPTVTITPPPPHPPIQLPLTNAQPPSGAPAIKPHLDGVPAFTTDDMATYIKNHPLPDNFGKGGQPSIVQNSFLPASTVGQMLNAPSGVFGQLGPVGQARSFSNESSSESSATARNAGQTQSAPAVPAEDKLLGLVVLQGNFVFPPATPTSPPPTSPYAYEVFDAQSGNLLSFGGLTQPPTTPPTPTPTQPPTGRPTPTPTPRPTPTDTPAPQCQVVVQGSANNVNVDLSDINLDGSGPATQPNASSHIRYSQLPAGGSIFSPVNGATLHDVGIGADFGALDCARLRGFSYSGASTAPYSTGEVFVVKTPGGHYAKVQIAAGVGGPPQVQWVTYGVS
jgi:hypothetical protein